MVGQGRSYIVEFCTPSRVVDLMVCVVYSELSVTKFLKGGGAKL